MHSMLAKVTRGEVWHSPSARCAERIVSGTRLMLNSPEIFEEIDQAVLAAADESVTSALALKLARWPGD